MKAAIPFLALVLGSCGPAEQKAPELKKVDEPAARPPPHSLALSVVLEGGAKLGQNTFFKVRIRNISIREVDVVPSLDGSDVGWRYPLFTARLWGPDGKPILVDVGRCGNCNGLSKANVVALKPDEEFDPLAGESFLGHTYLTDWTPKQVGKHRLVLTVDYSATDPAEWNGSEERIGADPKKVRDVLARVPLERMESTVEFEVTKQP